MNELVKKFNSQKTNKITRSNLLADILIQLKYLLNLIINIIITLNLHIKSSNSQLKYLELPAKYCPKVD